jgi:hypothetical protein
MLFVCCKNAKFSTFKVKLNALVGDFRKGIVLGILGRTLAPRGEVNPWGRRPSGRPSIFLNV